MLDEVYGELQSFVSRHIEVGNQSLYEHCQVGVGFFTNWKRGLIEAMLLSLVHDVSIRKIPPVVSGLTAVEFSTDMTLFRRWTNTSKKSFGAVHHSELDFVHVSATS